MSFNRFQHQCNETNNTAKMNEEVDGIRNDVVNQFKLYRLLGNASFEDSKETKSNERGRKN